MRILGLISLALATGTAAAPTIAFATEKEESKETTLTYPETKTVDVVEEQFGEYIADPYRWLENDVREDEEVAAWVAAQNSVTDSYLKKLNGRKALADSMTKLYSTMTSLACRSRRAESYFTNARAADRIKRCLYVRDSADGEERVLIDPAGWSEDGATALAGWKPSADGKYLVYAVQDGGSDWRTLKTLDVESGETTADTVEWAKFTGLSLDARQSRFPLFALPGTKKR